MGAQSFLKFLKDAQGKIRRGEIRNHPIHALGRRRRQRGGRRRSQRGGILLNPKHIEKLRNRNLVNRIPEWRTWPKQTGKGYRKRGRKTRVISW